MIRGNLIQLPEISIFIGGITQNTYEYINFPILDGNKKVYAYNHITKQYIIIDNQKIHQLPSPDLQTIKQCIERKITWRLDRFDTQPDINILINHIWKTGLPVQDNNMLMNNEFHYVPFAVIRKIIFLPDLIIYINGTKENLFNYPNFPRLNMNEYVYAYNYLLTNYIISIKRNEVSIGAISNYIATKNKEFLPNINGYPDVEILCRYYENPSDILLPYQNIDLRKGNRIYYGLKSEIIMFSRSVNEMKMEFEHERIPYNKFFNFNIIDLYKMSSRSGSDKYKYIYQNNSELLKHVRDNVIPIIDKINSNSSEYDIVFIPNAENIDTTNETKEHIRNVKISYFCLNELPRIIDRISPRYEGDVQKIKGMIYDSFIEMISLYVSNFNIESLLEQEMKEVRFIKADELKRFYKERFNIINDHKSKNYGEMYRELNLNDTDINNCDKLIDIYYEELKSHKKNERLTKLRNVVKQCIFNELKIEETQMNPTGNILIDSQHFITAPTVLPNNVLTDKCKDAYDDIVNDIERKDEAIRQYLLSIKNILNPERENFPSSTYPRKWPSPTDIKSIHDRKLVPEFEFLLEYIPEWLKAIETGNYNEAIKHAQLILGNYDVVKYFRYCGVYFKSSPFINSPFSFKNITWTQKLNNVLLATIFTNNDIFPVRFVVNCKDNVIDADRYTQLRNINQYLLGTLVIKVTDRKRFGKRGYKFYYLHIYTEFDGSILNTVKLGIYNYRKDLLVPGTSHAKIKALYQELNSILYYDEDTHLLRDQIGTKLERPIKLNCYMYKNDILKKTISLFVTKYSKIQIRERMLSLGFTIDYIDSIFNKLVKCEIKKNYNKQFILIMSDTNNEMIGGNVSVHFDAPKQNIVYNKTIDYYDDFFPKELYIKYTEHQKHNDFVSVYNILFPLTYLATSQSFEKSQTKMYDKLSKSDNFVRKILDTPIVNYKFVSNLSFTIMDIINKYDLLKQKMKSLIISKNSHMLDGIRYYTMYRINDSQKNIDFLYYDNDRYRDRTIGYTNKYNINTITVDKTLNNNQIKDILSMNKLSSYDNIFFDIIFRNCDNVNEPCIYLSNKNLFAIIPQLILSLSKLKPNGNLVLVSDMMTKKYMLDIIAYISSSFKKYNYYEHKYVLSPSLLSIIVFRKYSGSVNLDILYELNKRNYEYDNTGFGKTEYHLNNIFEIDNKQFYDEYGSYCRNIITKSFSKFIEVSDIIKHSNDESYVINILKKNIYDALLSIKIAGMDIPPWIELSKMYENITLRLFKRKKIDSRFDLLLDHKKDISISEELNINYDFVKTSLLSESVFTYIDTHEYKRYKHIEGVVNNIQKQLNKALFDVYDININGKYVSRAWLKFYGLLHKTHLLKNHKNNDTIKTLHICEAPGCFIAAMDYYIKNNSNIKNYDWHAQTLKVSSIGDEYGFIRTNRDRWDFASSGTGDITNPDNIEYYLKTYHDVDGVIGDCGEAWTEGSTTNLAYYQLIYALLIPKKGGFFVAKTFASNFNNHYLAALYIILSHYDKVMIYKSNINFWSPEIYLVGRGFKGISEVDKNNIIDCVKKNHYLLPELPYKYLQTYDNLTQQIILDYTESKNMLIFLSENERIYSELFPTVEKMLIDKNKKYVKKYMSHLPNLKKFIDSELSN